MGVSNMNFLLGLCFLNGLLVLHTSKANQVTTGTTVVGNTVTLQLKTPRATNITRWTSTVYPDLLGYIVEMDGNCMASDTIGSNSLLFAWHCHRQTEYSLILKNVSHRWHNTTWTGTAIYIGGATQTFVLYVKVPITFVDISPKKSTLDVPENTAVQLTCKTSKSRPFADVHWYTDMLTPGDTGDDRLISVNNTSVLEIDSEGLGVTTSTLTYYPSKSDNGARMYCLAVNSDLDPVKSNLQPLINVLYHRNMRFSVKGHRDQTHVTVIEDTNVIFRCNMDSNPRSQLRVMHENDILRERNSVTSVKYLTYVIRKATCESSGRYTCVSNNGAYANWASMKVINLFVQCKPKPYPPITKEVAVHKGEVAVLIVNLITHIDIDNVNITWARLKHQTWIPMRIADNRSDSAVELTTMTATTRAGLNITEAKLTLYNVTENDTGDYKMTASNTAGVYEAIVTLLVNDVSKLMANSPNRINKDKSRENGDQIMTHVTLILLCGVAFVVLTTTALAVGVVIHRRRKRSNQVEATQSAQVHQNDSSPNIYTDLQGRVDNDAYSAVCITDADEEQEQRSEMTYENTKIEGIIVISNTSVPEYPQHDDK